MGFTDLLDELTQLGPWLVGEGGPKTPEVINVRNEVNAALLPVWSWLDSLKDAADQIKVDWRDLDAAPADESIEAFKSTVSVLKRTVERGDAEAVRSELTTLGEILVTIATETDAQLKRLKVDKEHRNRLLLPLHAHVSELAVTTGSSEALSLARKSLGQVGERQLSDGIARKVEYEQSRADFLRYSAITAFLFSIGWLVASYLAFRASDFSSSGAGISEAIIKLGIGSAVLGLAVYLAKESRGHRERASSWQSVELQMDTIDLYCASLPSEHRDAIRLAFGLEVFSGAKLFGAVGTTGVDLQSDGKAVTQTELDKAVGLLTTLSRRLP
jgi:hypothetical protein